MRALLLMLLCSPVLAQSWSGAGNLGLTSNYVSRGFTQSWSRPALQGGWDLSRTDGWFVGTWASTLSDREFVDGKLEVDLYAGRSFSLGDGTVALGLYHYLYPGSASPAVNGDRYDYTELKLGWAQGMVSANLFVTISKAWFGTFADGRGTAYAELNLSPGWDGGWSGLLHAGMGRAPDHPEANWRDLKLGVTKAFDGGWSLQLAWTKVWDKNGFWTSADYRRDPQGQNPVKVLGKGQTALTLLKTF
jgi:uncharacterized protein (TIGR02001 family)